MNESQEKVNIENTVVLDFDGVFHDHNGEDYKNIAPPLEGLQDFINRLKSKGYEVIVLSTRSPEEIKSYLKRFNIDGIAEVTSTKPPAKVYVDDRAINFSSDWGDVLRRIDSFRPWWKLELREGKDIREGLTEEEMPARSAKQYGFMQAAAHGKLKGMGPSEEVAREFVEKTPHKKRRKFAQALAKKR